MAASLIHIDMLTVLSLLYLAFIATIVGLRHLGLVARAL
ncbi:O-acetylserine/cysteine export protein [Raoultella planticola]|uniref:O-acetylserine/cysteine export protein n=1 Tax=Raoultella planticola TaxID=575 RepID=A0A485A216_RAOPL|nr:O-acetylserine/cysteine export protein [Raoultella planticola]